jgi:mRNA interferase RelE/StbE
MKTRLTPLALQDYVAAPLAVQKAFDKQTKFLVHNLKHPSLHAKKYDESKDIWQARVNRDWRFYFSIDGDTYIIRDIIPHPK